VEQNEYCAQCGASIRAENRQFSPWSIVGGALLGIFTWFVVGFGVNWFVSQGTPSMAVWVNLGIAVCFLLGAVLGWRFRVFGARSGFVLAFLIANFGGFAGCTALFAAQR